MGAVIFLFSDIYTIVNSEVLDESLLEEQSDQGLHCLSFSVCIFEAVEGFLGIKGYWPNN